MECLLKEESPYIAELKKRLSDMIVKEDDGHIEYEGGFQSYGLLKEKDVAVADTRMPKGEVFKPHTHDIEREFIIVVNGVLEFDVDGTKYIVKEGGSFTIDPGEEHFALPLEDTRVIAITIPADDGFPSAKVGEPCRTK